MLVVENLCQNLQLDDYLCVEVIHYDPETTTVLQSILSPHQAVALPGHRLQELGNPVLELR